MNKEYKYGVFDENSRTVVEDDEKTLKEQGFQFICSSSKSAYRKIFARLSQDELKSPMALDIEYGAYKDSFEHDFYKPGDFIKQRLDELCDTTDSEKTE